MLRFYFYVIAWAWQTAVIAHRFFAMIAFHHVLVSTIFRVLCGVHNEGEKKMCESQISLVHYLFIVLILWNISGIGDFTCWDRIFFAGWDRSNWFNRFSRGWIGTGHECFTHKIEGGEKYKDRRRVPNGKIYNAWKRRHLHILFMYLYGDRMGFDADHVSNT